MYYFDFCNPKTGCIFAIKGSDVRPPHFPFNRLRAFI